MVWHNLFNFFYTIAVYIIGLLPDLTDVDLSNIANIESAFHTFRSYLITANMFFPVDLSFALFSAVIGVQVALAIWKLIRWVASILSVGIIK